MMIVCYAVYVILLIHLMLQVDGVHSPGRDMESTNVQEKKRAKLDIDLNEPYVEEQISENERTPSASENAIIHDHLPAPQKEGDVEAQLTKRPYVYRPRKSLEELSQNKKAIKSRKRFERLRQGEGKEKFYEILQKQRDRMKPYSDKEKEATKKYGYSTNSKSIKIDNFEKKLNLV